MKYTIAHSSIAALQYVTMPDGHILSVVGETSEPQPEFDALPLAVRAAVNRQFGAVFSLPYERRQAFIESAIPFEVEVTE